MKNTDAAISHSIFANLKCAKFKQKALLLRHQVAV